MTQRILTPFNLLQLSADPGGGTTGDVYFNTTSLAIKVYNGSAWVAVGGGSTQRTFAFFTG